MSAVSYAKLSDEDKRRVLQNLETRRAIFEEHVLQTIKHGLPRSWKIVLVGDRPGPSAPLEPDYHHTPFYSTKHCSGWLNALLMTEKIREADLIWINAYDKDGKPNNYERIQKIADYNTSHPLPIIALGGNANKWLKNGGFLGFASINHPQFHKRFRNKDRYELPDLIRRLTRTFMP